MQDSIEDYIRISRNIKSDSINENSKISPEILATVQRKKEYEAYAMKIVVFLLDGKLRPEIFLKCLKYINPEYYQDVVEERAISKLCGYPLCGKKIPEMPKQKYFISTKANKVYDISDRKNYCSNFCYKGSVYLKKQIDTSPLWLRNHKEMAECSLLPPTEVGTPGEEVDQGVAKGPSELPPFTSIAQFTDISLQEVGEIEKTSKRDGKSNLNYKQIRGQQSLSIINENDSVDSENELDKNDLGFHDSSDDGSCSDKEEYKEKKDVNVGRSDRKEAAAKDKKVISQEEKLEYLISKLRIKNEPKTRLIESPPMKIKITDNTRIEDNTEIISKIKIGPKKQKTSAKASQEFSLITSNKDNCNDIVDKVKVCIEEWVTIDTFIYIYGEDKVKQILNENKMSEYFDQLKVTELETAQQLKYMNICRQLQLQELAEEKFDNAVLGHSLKPLPDFKQLKEEAQELDLKVRSYYSGVFYEKPDTNFPTKSVKENEENGDETAVLPLVDVTAQNALRRKVFLNSISKSLRKLIDELKLEESIVLTGVHDLVKSFKLQAHNIVFKPGAWSIVAVILLKILSLKNKDIERQLMEQRSAEYIDLILSRYIGVENTIKDILALLYDVSKFVENYITQD